MRGFQRIDYNAIVGRMPYERHLRNKRKEREKEWPLFDDPPASEGDIDYLRTQVGGALEYSITKHFLTHQDIEDALSAVNKGKSRKQRAEYHAFLETLRENFCVPAMRDVLAGIFPSVRTAILARLAEEGIQLE